MKLQKATEDDVDLLAELWYSLAKDMEEYSEFNKLVYDSPDEVPADGFRRHLESEEFTEYLIVEAGETIGFLTTREGSHPSRQYTKYTNIVNLLVAEEYRNEGYGTDVVRQVKQRATERGCDHLKVSCEWHNDEARTFYKDNGFEEKQVQFVQKLD